jgi:MazG-like family
MLNVRIIEELKADLLCLIGDFFKQLTKGSNVAQSALLESISRSIIVLYLLAEKLGFSPIEVDEDMKKKLKSGIIEGDSIEKESKALSKLYTHIKERN